MTVTIAVAGKGGTGKTTLSGLLMRYLIAKLAKIPYDSQLVEFDRNGRPLVELPTDAPISRAVEQIAQQLLKSVK